MVLVPEFAADLAGGLNRIDDRDVVDAGETRLQLDRARDCRVRRREDELYAAGHAELLEGVFESRSPVDSDLLGLERAHKPHGQLVETRTGNLEQILHPRPVHNASEPTRWLALERHVHHGRRGSAVAGHVTPPS